MASLWDLAIERKFGGARDNIARRENEKALMDFLRQQDPNLPQGINDPDLALSAAEMVRKQQQEKTLQDFQKQAADFYMPSKVPQTYGKLPTPTEARQDLLAYGQDMGISPTLVDQTAKGLEAFLKPKTEFQEVGGTLYGKDAEAGRVFVPEGFTPPTVDPYEKLPPDIRAYLTAGTDPAVRQAIEAQMRDKQRAAAAGATNVNNILDQGGPKFGTIPPGMMLVQDESGGYKMSPVPGSPAEREEIDSKKKSDLALRNARAKGRVVVANIDKALEKTGLFTTGFVGKALSAVPGSPAYDLGETLDTVKANIGFDTLQKMREASPTGGALGAVSERELSQLERVLGSLDQAQSREQLVENLIAVKTHYNNWKAIMEEAGKTPSAWTGQDESGGIKWDSQ